MYPVIFRILITFSCGRRMLDALNPDLCVPCHPAAFISMRLCTTRFSSRWGRDRLSPDTNIQAQRDICSSRVHARTQEYNIAASWASLYCLTRRVPVLYRRIIYFLLNGREQHTHTSSLIITLFSFDLFIFFSLSLPFSLYPSLSGLPFF